jgi:prevent-host-death family protein
LAILAEIAFEDIMAAVTATDAKNRFGQMLEMARTEPVHIQKNGRDVGVLISPEEFQRMQTGTTKPAVNPLVVKLHEESVRRYGKVYEALAK